MSFRGFLRPGQGFKQFTILHRVGGTTATGRPQTKKFIPSGELYGIVSQASPKEIEQWKQDGHPITHTIIQRGTEERVKATDILELCEPDQKPRYFIIRGKPKDVGQIGHFTVYKAEEREDLQ